MSENRSLNVYRDSALVGTLYDERPLRFDYAASWLNSKGPKAIAPALGLATESHSGEAVEAYFENLIPEAAIRDLLKVKYQVSSTFGLLGVIGSDTAGALILARSGESLKDPEYRPTTWEEVKRSIEGLDSNPPSSMHMADRRLSLAGAQNKISILVMPDGTPAIPTNEMAPTSHILKPNIGAMGNKIWCSALNETFVMQLAGSLDLGVAEAQYQPVVKACLIKRYDRVGNQQKNLIRLHQLDLCQLDGKPSHIKYESDNGPSLQRCRNLLQENGVPANDLIRLIQWVFFNLFVGNNDSHAKNLSLYFPPNEGVRLTPFYDLLSTTLYPGLSTHFAFKIGGENLPAKIDRYAIIRMANELGFKPNYVINHGAKLAEKLLKQLDTVTNNLSKVAHDKNEPVLLKRLNDHIRSNTKKLQSRWQLG